MFKLPLAPLILILTADMANAGFGGMANVGEEHEGLRGSTGFVTPAALISAVIGAVVGYRLEQAFHRHELREHGATNEDLKGMQLGGKIGAAIGAVLGPTLFHLIA